MLPSRASYGIGLGIGISAHVLIRSPLDIGTRWRWQPQCQLPSYLPIIYTCPVHIVNPREEG